MGFVSETTSFDDADDAPNHTLENPLQLLGLRRGSEVKPKVLRGAVGPVENQSVEMDVEVELPAESLDEGDRTSEGRTGAGSLWSGSTPERAEDGPHEYAQHVRGQLAIEAKAVA
jgi:hypothetical protein